MCLAFLAVTEGATVGLSMRTMMWSIKEFKLLVQA